MPAELVLRGTASGPAGGVPWRRSWIAFAALLALALPAFWPTYLNPPRVERDWHVHVHGLAMFGWMVMLVAQPLLLHRGRIDLHRRVGRLAWVLAPVVMASTVLLAHHRAAAGLDAVLLYFLYVQAALLVLYAAAVAQALRHRRRPALHARYMVCTALAAFDPIAARALAIAFGVEPPLLQAITYGAIGALLLVLWWRDRRGGQHPAVFGPMAALFAIVLLPTFVVPRLPAWQGLAESFARLPLP